MAECLPILFGFYIFLSLVLHIGEIVLNGFFAAQFLEQGSNSTWFTIIVGLMVLPMVTIQLVSAVLLLQRRSSQLSCVETMVTVVMHFFQLGFIWRHIRILKEDDVLWKKRDFADMCLLRMFYAFSASLPIFGIQVYTLVSSTPNGWVVYSASATSLVAICWALCSFRRQYETSDFESIVLTWPGTMFRLIWRLGEMVARLVALAVFASVYGSWVFVVIGLHWVTMLTCICTSVLGHLDVAGMNCCHKFIMNLLVSYIYIFCHINFSDENAQFRYITYYTIMFLENAVLVVVWIFTVENNDTLQVHSIIFISSLAFFVGMVSMAIYYRFFHIPSTKLSSVAKDNMCVPDGCINCKLSLCAKHSFVLQRPFSAGWVSQYQKALYDGHYYKNLLQDSLIDSMSEWEVGSSSSDSTSEGGGSQTQHFKKRPMVFKSSGTYSHRRFIQSGIQQQSAIGTDSETDASSVVSHPHLSSSDDTADSDISFSHGPDDIKGSQIHLLTESWDNLLAAVNEGYETDTSVHPLTAFRPISAQSLEDWYSDGYSTDHTTDSYPLPITVLAKNNRYSISVASDSTDCTMCKNIKAYRNRKYSQKPRKPNVVKDKIIEEREEKSFSDAKESIDTPRSSAWYNCGESSDSACPQEYLSSSNLETTFSEEEEGVYESGMELII